MYLITSENKHRSYRRVVLPNALGCLLIHDEKAENMAMSLSVAVGHFCDPDGLEGLAHLLAKSLLNCIKSYGDFSTYLSENHGCMMSTTNQETTVFSVVAKCPATEVIPRFAQFFVEPVFTENISNENAGAPGTDEVGSSLINHLHRQLTSKGHPYHKFSPGNVFSVERKCMEKGVDIKGQLKQLYDRFYSSNLMGLVVFGKDTLDELETVVNNNFCTIINNKRDPFKLGVHPCQHEFRKIFVEVAPIKGKNSLRIEWPVARSLLIEQESDSCQYVSHIFGYERKGSLPFVMKKLGWIESLEAGELGSTTEFAFFFVSVGLTSEGNEHVEDICGIIFNYIKMCKKSKPKKFLFDELQEVSCERFCNRMKESPVHILDEISSNMLVFPPARWVVGSSVAQAYSVSGIQNILNELSPENVRIFWASNQPSKNKNFTELLNNTPYSVKSIDKDDIKVWMSSAPKVDMYLPTQVDFLTSHKAAEEMACASRLFKQAFDMSKEDTDEVEQSAFTRTTGQRVDIQEKKAQQVLLTRNKDNQAVNGEQTSLRRSLRNMEATKHKRQGISAKQISNAQHSQSLHSYTSKEENQASRQSIKTTIEKHEPSAEQMQEKYEVCIIYDNKMLEHIPLDEKHAEQPGRISAIYDRLQSDDLLQRCAVYDSEEVDLKHVIEVHRSAYVKRIMQGSIQTREKEEGDMFLSNGSLDAIFLAAGGAVKGCEMVASKRHLHSFAVVRPPGHHAKSDEERGFCFFNNVAIAAKYLKNHHNMKKILILDWDVHIGDGTSEIFMEDGNVLFISMHRHPFWPFSDFATEDYVGIGDGRGFNCNICWDPKVKDDDLFAVFDYIVMPLAREFDPDIILISAGFDAASGDTVGGCDVTHVGYATVLNKLLELKKSIVMVLEGGYKTDVLAECCSSCVKVLLGDTTVVTDMTDYYPLQSTWESILKLRGLDKEYWTCFNCDIPQEVRARIRPKSIAVT